MNKRILLRLPCPESALNAANAACAAIPPAWPLTATVAVNPFLGQTDETLAEAGARLARAAGVRAAMPRDWYARKIEAGEIEDADIAAAIDAAQRPGATVEAVRSAAREAQAAPMAAPTLADLAADANGVDWPAIVADRFSAWASGYFDQGQALWAAPRKRDPWSAWRAFATHDLTPEILGLSGFAAKVDAAPDRIETFIVQAVAQLGLTEESTPAYFHRLLMTLGGWSQLARYELWRAEQAGESEQTLLACLAIRLFWEQALLEHGGEALAQTWSEAQRHYVEPAAPTEAMAIDALLQEAAERASQRRLAGRLAEPGQPAAPERPVLQAAFCIDVRSEVFRRALEAVDPSVETLGFAGFFGLGVAHRGFASDVEERRLPVLLNPGLSTRCGGEAASDAEGRARIAARAARAWGRFRLAAVSSFAFVESAAPLYLGKLARDALSLGAAETPGPAPRLDPAVDLETRVGAAETILRAMSLTERFARLVILAGHGASVVNNLHASALQCGACGGYSGDVNARLLAGLLNDQGVRQGLAARGIDIPADTLFVGALHDTTSDGVRLFSSDHPSPQHGADLKRAEAWLEAAGRACRGERAGRLPRAGGEADLRRRGRDWAEARPEWGLAGCQAFIAAPRRRTAGRDLKGRAFLHSYDWRSDTEFKVLELILTAPVVVASWISLQYYGSCVAPQMFGSGNKLLHNVVGGVGVFEGNGGVLRTGLAWQSVHDGESFAHDPLRLSVCVEAPRAAILDVLRRHDGVRALFDHGWLHLFALDEQGQMAWRYRPGLAWEPFDTEAARVEAEPCPPSAEPVAAAL